ncbi:hypothetical protein C8Q73DRAFT_173088 [Cubamyces lactineus]|nr:hypothetical protein C8Q73DRAFT_173088 [Cubamyces lactineus]
MICMRESKRSREGGRRSIDMTHGALSLARWTTTFVEIHVRGDVPHRRRRDALPVSGRANSIGRQRLRDEGTTPATGYPNVLTRVGIVTSCQWNKGSSCHRTSFFEYIPTLSIPAERSQEYWPNDWSQLRPSPTFQQMCASADVRTARGPGDRRASSGDQCGQGQYWRLISFTRCQHEPSLRRFKEAGGLEVHGGSGTRLRRADSSPWAVGSPARLQA